MLAKKNSFKIILLTLATLVISACSSTAPPIGDAKEIIEQDWSKGNPAATVTLLEFGDFQCPACAAYAPVVSEVAEEYKDRVNFVYRHFPLTQIHPNALPAARAAEAAGQQGKFFEMHDILYARQSEWSRGGSPEDKFVAYAEELALDITKYNNDYNSSEARDKIRRDMTTGSRLGVTGTPSFYIDGEPLPNPRSIEEFKAVLDAKLQASN